MAFFWHLTECIDLFNNNLRDGTDRTWDIARYVMCIQTYRSHLVRYSRYRPLIRAITDRMIEIIGATECPDMDCVSDIFLAGHCLQNELTISYKQSYAHEMCYRYTYESPSLISSVFTQPYDSEAVEVDTCLDAVKTAVLTGNLPFLKELTQFGAIILKPKDDMDEWNYTRKVLLELFEHHEPVRNSREAFFEGSLLCKFNPTSRKRLFLVMRVLDVFAKIRNNLHCRNQYVADKRLDYLKGIRLLFETIPVPVISSQEILTCLVNLLRGLIPKEDIREVVRDYESLLPESLKPRAPRSLQHLTRCGVRQILREKGKLPHGVKSLPVPKSMQIYLSCGEPPIAKRRFRNKVKMPKVNLHYRYF